MNRKEDQKKQGNIRCRQKLIDDANKKLAKQSEFVSLPHLVRILLCKKLGLNASDY